MLIATRSIAQTGAVSGTVSDAGNNKILTGATISINNTNKRTFTDIDGKFNITGINKGTYSVTVSYVGYDTKKIEDIQIQKGDFTTLNIALNPAKSTNLTDVIVTTTSARKENLATVLNIRKNSAVVSDIISADMIKKSPDKNTSDVLRRVSGTSIQENKFVVVRGMNDRYNEAMLNGAVLPSSEPDRKAFAFDIFPSEVVDNITVIKSATPELPGSFAGGLIQINTKDVPDINFVSLKASLGYNSITTGKNAYTYTGGNTDWLGIDNGARAIPTAFPDKETFAGSNIVDGNKYARLFTNSWGYYGRQAPLNPSFQASAGFNAHLSDNAYPRLGGIFGLTYSSSLKFNEYERSDFPNPAEGLASYTYRDSTYNTNILLSVLGNFTLKLNANNKFFLNNIYSVNSLDQTIIRSGFNLNLDANIKANSFFFASNRIHNTQIGGDHLLPKSKLRIKWLGYYTDLFRNEPDYRRMFYYQPIGSEGPYTAIVSTSPSTNINIGRLYSTTNTITKGANLDFSLPFELFDNTQTFKMGAAYYYDIRVRDARSFSPYFNSGNFDFNLLFDGQDSIFRPSNFDNKGFKLYEDQTSSNKYDGTVENKSAYAMFDNKFSKKIRLVWGVRYENYEQIVNTFSNDRFEPVLIKNNFKDVLPSANFIYTVIKNSNIRASYSKSLARPLYRELASLIFYDFLTNTTYIGNNNLTETKIDNFEIRWEQYFPGAQYYSISAFYKKFKNPIEQNLPISGGDSRTVNFINSPEAQNQGIEIEGRKNFGFISPKLETLVAYANVSFINSKTTIINTEGKADSSRPLQGQSPYIINTSLQYTEPQSNLAISVLYNVIGPRIVLVGGGFDLPIWERTHATLDAKISKTFLKKGIIEFTVADILHKNDYQYWNITGDKNYEKNIDVISQQQRFGLNASLSVGYRF